MGEHVLQISRLSFQCECSRIKLNILKLYVHLLGVLWNLFSSLFSFVIGFPSHVDTRLISDKTRINYCSYPRGQIFSLGIRLTRLTIPRSAGSFKRISFFFSLMVLCAALFWNLDFFHIPNYVLGFSTNKRQLLMHLHPLRNTWQITMRLHPVMNERQRTYFRCLKNYHVLIFLAVSFSVPQHGRGICLSADTHMANREWGPPMPISPCNDREGGRERQPLPLPIQLTIIVIQ